MEGECSRWIVSLGECSFAVWMRLIRLISRKIVFADGRKTRRKCVCQDVPYLSLYYSLHSRLTKLYTKMNKVSRLYGQNLKKRNNF